MDLWIRTSGAEVPFLAFGIGRSAENVGKSKGKCENNALGKKTVFGPFFGSMDGLFAPKTESITLREPFMVG